MPRNHDEAPEWPDDEIVQVTIEEAILRLELGEEFDEPFFYTRPFPRKNGAKPSEQD